MVSTYRVTTSSVAIMASIAWIDRCRRVRSGRPIFLTGTSNLGMGPLNTVSSRCMAAALSADEFIARIAGFELSATSTQTDLLALYLTEHAASREVTASGIASLREALHLPSHSRLPQYLSEQTKRRH